MSATRQRFKAVAVCLLALLHSHSAQAAPSCADLEKTTNALLAKQKFEKAAPLLQRAADRGCARSQFNLANMFGQGLGVPQSYEQMRTLWTKAADAGYPRACLNAARAFERGDGGPVDLSRALELFERAADLGESAAAAKLGNYYLTGLGSSKKPSWYNPVAGVRWLNIAKQDPDANAVAMLADLERTVPSSELKRWSSEAVKTLDSYDALGPGPTALPLGGQSSRLLYIAHMELSRLFGLQGFTGSAGGPTLQSRDSPDAYVKTCQTILHSRGLDSSAVCTFAQRKTFRRATKEAIIASSGQLFDTMLPGDTLILSDRITTHYTFVFRVDRSADRVFFVDIWPEKFFLRKGLNGLGAKATLVDHKHGRKLVEVSRADFEKAVIGAVFTRDRIVQ